MIRYWRKSKFPMILENFSQGKICALFFNEEEVEFIYFILK